MIMAGGTGGHVFPGLAVAQYLQTQNWQVRWLGTADKIEANLVPKHNIQIDFIQISGLRGKRLRTQLLAPLYICRAVYQAKKIFYNYQPDVALGMGGYVSGPGGLAAWLCGVPLVLHEQNSIAGLTNRILAKIAKKVLQAFPSAFLHADVVGNPLRSNLLTFPPPTQRLATRTGAIRILVIGGSQGAQILNQVLPGVASQFSEQIIIWHQVGKGSFTAVQQAYQKYNQQHKVIEFIDDMAAAYSWADVVICRSGALTVSEIAAVGLPAIFVPFEHKDYQQYWNALLLKEAGAGIIIEQSQFTVSAVSNLLARWDRATLIDMAEKARAIAIPNATKHVANAIIATEISHRNI
ncbi:undecaprenyldiphospho-muramoylpentapeptide beta-N-acetylglucosaminyltransferase [Candidatus Fukatsuia anoeciicola]|uniref:undecaprenyldiphospho-muramoylpentapeptide beta-N-acetylglucosaminyltransferase n=1 Tax=Candidatus Fukatsuia anoeciicola TaxID=2994492 RepID=UPI003464C1A4